MCAVMLLIIYVMPFLVAAIISLLQRERGT